jgi:hypothetical protein
MHVFLTLWMHKNDNSHEIIHGGDGDTLYIRIHDASEWLTCLRVLPRRGRLTKATGSAASRLEESSRVQRG